MYKLMKIKLNTINEVKKFNEAALVCKSDIYVGQGRYLVNAKSTMGLFSLNLLEELELHIEEKDNGESLNFIQSIRELGIIK